MWVGVRVAGSVCGWLIVSGTRGIKNNMRKHRLSCPDQSEKERKKVRDLKPGRERGGRKGEMGKEGKRKEEREVEEK